MEALLLSITGACIGLMCGVGLAAIFTQVVNLQSTSWTLPLSVPWAGMLSALLIACVAGVLGALLPAFRIARLSLRDALAQE